MPVTYVQVPIKSSDRGSCHRTKAILVKKLSKNIKTHALKLRIDRTLLNNVSMSSAQANVGSSKENKVNKSAFVFIVICW